MFSIFDDTSWIDKAMRIGKAIGDYKHQQRLELLEKNPLMQAQAQYYRNLSETLPYQAEIYRAQARQAIPASALKDISTSLFGIPSESILRLSQAQIYPAVALGNIANVSSNWVNNEALNKFFRGLGPGVLNLLSGFSALPDLNWGW